MTDGVYDAEFEPLADALEADEDPNRLFERVTYHMVRLERRRRLHRQVKWTLLGLFLLITTAGCVVAWDQYGEDLADGFSLDPRKWPVLRRWIQ